MGEKIERVDVLSDLNADRLRKSFGSNPKKRDRKRRLKRDLKTL